MGQQPTDQHIRELLGLMFDGYQTRKKEKKLYNSTDLIPQTIISTYYNNIEPDFDNIVNKFKRRYIYNEARVESNSSKAEEQGIGLVYDYIQKYNTEKEQFNIFLVGLKIHQILYSKLDEATNDGHMDKIIESINTNSGSTDLSQNKALVSALRGQQKFGGKLRNSTAFLLDTGIEVMDAKSARMFFQSYLNQDKIDEYHAALNDPDIFKYIDYCVKVTTDLIEAQPFEDGNKRTFRSLLNLMFKEKNLPPVYVKTTERDEYKEALIRAMKDDDYEQLNRFYYYKICDSIIDLDVEASKESIESKENEFVKTIK